MSGLDSNLTDILTHAPELQQTPGVTVGMAQGLTAVNAPIDPRQVAHGTSLALIGQGLQQANNDLKDVSSPEEHQSHDDGGGILGHVAGFLHNNVVNPLENAASAVEHVAVHDVLHPVGTVLSAGLNEVTHTYRYFHDVWERHGALAALGELAVVGATFAGVTVASGGNVFAGVLAAEAVGDVMGRLSYKDSWQATNDGEAYVDSSGYKVSPGRDFARLADYLTPGFLDFGHDKEGNLTGNHAGLVSGLADATFDLTLDPTLKLGSLVRANRIAKTRPVLAASWKDVDNGLVLARRPVVDQEGILPNNIQVLYRQHRGIQDAFNRIAGMNTTQVLSEYPALYGMAPALGAAKTGQEVADAFEMALTARNFSFMKYGLPHTTLTRRMLGGVGINVPTAAGVSTKIQSRFSREALDADGNPLISTVTGLPIRVPSGPAGHIINGFTAYAPFAFNSKTLKISGARGNPDDPEFLRGFYSVLRYSQNASTSKAVLARLAESKDTAERVAIITNGYRDALRASGLPDDHPFVASIVGDLNFLNKQALGAKYATDVQGRTLRMVDDEGNIINRGVFINQTGEIAFPDFNEWNRVIRESRGKLWGTFAKSDDFMNRYITTRFFKRLVLLSLGFGLRVSAGELIPASLGNGARSVLSGGLAAASVKLNPASDEIRDVLGGLRATVPGRSHVGVVESIDESGEATIRFGNEVMTAPAAKATFYHNDIADDEVLHHVKELGIEFHKDEIPHVRAAVGKALYGVSKALGDPLYREVALMNVLANEGHLVAPGLSSSHDLPRGFEGINKATRQAALSAGINIPKKTGLGKQFRLWDSGDDAHPLFWKFALDEAAADPGIRAAAREYGARVRLGAHAGLPEQIASNGGGITYDLRTGDRVTEGYSVARHPAHEAKVQLDRYSTSDLRAYLEKKHPELLEEGNYLGVWEEDGHKFFDVAQVVHSRDEAYQLAYERGELAIADLAAIERGDWDNAFIPVHAEGPERDRIRSEYKARNPIRERSAEDAGTLAGGERAAGSGQEAAGSQRRLDLGRHDQSVADDAAVKADRSWWESDDAQAIESRAQMAGYSVDPEGYSRIRVEALKGLTHGPDGHVNLDVLDALGRGETPTIAELAEKDLRQRPLAVKGRTLEPIAELGTLDRVIGAAWKPIHGIINSLSRAPIWTMLVTDEYRMFQPWVKAGLMTKAEAHSISQVRAMNRMLPLIHNTLLRNKFSLVARNAFPFYFAQEQAYKRYGRAMFSNPRSFREAQLFLHGLHTTGALQEDDTGQQHIVFPGAGDLPFFATLALNHLGVNVLPGVPSTVSGNTISLRTVVPEAIGPGVGPAFSAPLKAMAAFFPQTDPLVRDILGDFGGAPAANSTLSQQFIPNATLRRIWEALDPSSRSQAFGSTFAANAAWSGHRASLLWAKAEAIDPRAMDTSIPRSELDPRAAALMAKADRFIPLPGADPHDAQVAMDRLTNTTRVQLLFKAAFGLISPLAPSVEVGDVELHHELQALMKKYGAAEGLRRFQDKYPDAGPDTVFQSDNSDLGTAPPATAAALNFIESNRSWVNENNLAAVYLMPQTPGEFDPAAYSAELVLGLRQRKTPEQFLDAVYTSIGNAEFFPSLRSYQQQRDALLAQGQTDAAHQLGQVWNEYFNSLAKKNPIWYEVQFSAKKAAVAQQAYSQLVKAVNDPSTPASPQMPLVRQLIQDYQSFQQQVALARAGSGQYTESELKTQWKNYIDFFAEQNPAAQAVAYGVFRRLGDL